MAGSLYDHMIGLVIIGMIFVSAVAVVPTLSYVNLLYIDQQQLRNIAVDTLKTILLESGYPHNWSSTSDFDPEQVERFGLALAESSSFYVLDPDKVQRLVIGNPAGVMDYEAILTELGLQGYGFNFEIVPPFKVIVNDEDFDGESNPVTLANLTEGVEVLVTNNVGSPIPQATVEATFIYVIKQDDEVVSNYFCARTDNKTSVLGQCIIKPDIAHDPDDFTDFVIVFKVTVAEVASVKSIYMEGFNQHIMNASFIGENITLVIPEGPGWEKGSSGTRWIENVVLVNEDEVLNMYNGTESNEDKITWGGGYWGWSKLFSGLDYYDPLFFIFSINAPNPRRLVLFLAPEPNWSGSRVEAFGDSSGMRASSTAMVQRNVIISGMTYIAQLTLWKEYQ